MKAVAVSWHGFPRYSGDIDSFIRHGRENALRLMAALVQFEFGTLVISIDDLIAENQVIQLGVAPKRIDLMTALTGISFEEAWSIRVCAALDTTKVDIIGREALLRNKRASGRSKDLIDIDKLTKGFEK